MKAISPLVGDAGVSIEVFADFDTTGEQMLAQGREMFAWIPNAYVKYPCTHEGCAPHRCRWGSNPGQHDALFFARTGRSRICRDKGSREPVYVSPFFGRLDDRGENGMDLFRNIERCSQRGIGHVHVLAASIRHLNHLLGSFALQAELATAPLKYGKSGRPHLSLAGKGFRVQGSRQGWQSSLGPISHKSLDLALSWDAFDIHHDLTTKGIQGFVADYRSTLKQSA